MKAEQTVPKLMRHGKSSASRESGSCECLYLKRKKISHQ